MALPALSWPWIWGLALALAYLPGTMPAPILGRWGVLVIGLAWAQRWQAGLRWQLGLGLVLWLVWGQASLSWSPDPLTGQGEVRQLVILACAVWTFSGWSLAEVEELLSGLGLGLVLALPLMLLQMLSLAPWGPWQISAPAGLWQSREVLGELAGPLAAWALASRRWWLGLGLVLVCALTASRIGLAAGGLALAWVWVCRGHKWQALLLALVPALALALLACLWPAKLATALLRLRDWQTGLELAYWGLPWGLGLGFVRGASPLGQWIHSDLIQLILELGLPGVAILILCLARLYSGAMLALAVAMAIEATVSSVLRLPVSGLLSAVALGQLGSRQRGLACLSAGGRVASREGDSAWLAS